MSQPPQRRSPNFTHFLVTGGVIGLIAGVVLAVVGEDAPNYDAKTEIAYLAAFGVFIGLGVAGLLAVLIDLWLRRRSGN